MSLVLFEGFDFYGTAETLRKKYPVDVTNCQFVPGRTGSGYALCLPRGGQGKFVLPFLPGNQEYVLGFAFMFSGHENPLPGFVKLCNEGVSHLSLTLNLNGSVSALAGSPLDTAFTPLSPNAWYYLEIRGKISDTAGSVQVQINGLTVINKSPINSYNSSYGPSGKKKQINWIEFNNLPGSMVDLAIDDVYCLIPDGTQPDGFLGPVTVETLFPRGQGPQSQWTPSVPNFGPNWWFVTTPTPGMSLSSTTPSATDLYQFQVVDNAQPNKILAAEVNMLAEGGMGSLSYLAPMVQVNGNYYQGSQQSVPQGQGFLRQVYTANPDTGSGWTIPEFNVTEFGIRRIN